MENKRVHTIEDLLEQIQNTMGIIQNRKEPIHLTPELLADIDRLEKAVNHFKEDAQEFFDLLHVEVPPSQKEVLESTEVRTNDKQLIKRAKDIELEARVIKLALSKARGNKRSSSSQEEKQKIKERRKLFKSIGGDKNWIPL